MKTFKQSLKEESGIFIHNFIMVITMLTGYHLLFSAPDLFGKGLGLIMITYSCWLFATAIKKSVDIMLQTYFPELLKELDKEKKEKSE